MAKKTKQTEEYEWLVNCRSQNQRASLNLYEILDGLKNEKEEPLLTLAFDATKLVAVSFSLWRAVFLCASDIPKDEDYIGHAHAFLETLIKDNAINYTQDQKSREWTAFYYMDNALARLIDMQKDKPHILPNFNLVGESTRECWETMQNNLDLAIANLSNAVATARKKN